MSIDNIDLPPIVLQELYKNCLVESGDKIPSKSRRINDFQFLGDNGANILVLVNDPEALHIAEKQLEFLTKVLTPCKLDLSQIALINNSREKVDYKELTVFEPRIILMFGVEPANIGLPFTIPDFQIQLYNNIQYHTAPPLDKLENDKQMKQQLWENLKKLFL